MTEAVLASTYLTPTWAVIPFVGYLLMIAALPLFAGRVWEPNRNKLILAVAAGIPAVAGLAGHPDGVLGQLFHTGCDYLAFMALLGSLFAISGGIALRGALIGTTVVNTAFLAVGAILASIVGTTGAAALLIRPLLRANAHRQRSTHVVVFFIFIVANAGGLLTPLGDPPLFLGFLRGVPFTWTLRLWRHWLLANAFLLILFYIVDSTIFRKEDLERPGDLDRIAVEHEVPIHIAGKLNFLLLAGVTAILVVCGRLGLPPLAQDTALVLMIALSWLATPRQLRVENAFSWSPMVEVAALFAGIFATMIPALAILNARGAQLGLAHPPPDFCAR